MRNEEYEKMDIEVIRFEEIDIITDSIEEGELVPKN